MAFWYYHSISPSEEPKSPSSLQLPIESVLSPTSNHRDSALTTPDENNSTKRDEKCSPPENVSLPPAGNSNYIRYGMCRPAWSLSVSCSVLRVHRAELPKQLMLLKCNSLPFKKFGPQLSCILVHNMLMKVHKHWGIF